ncbi:MAG: flippase [Firmicutes bacterium]|nr:flippase [Bacillota bacterium]
MKKKSLTINAVLNMTKQLCAVLFPLITVPYVSRVLQKTNYGKVTFGSSIVSYFILLASLGISNYAIREGARIRDDKKAVGTFASQIFTINVTFSVLSYFLLALLLIFSAKMQSYQALIMVQSLSIVLTLVGADWVNSLYEDYFYLTIRYILMHTVGLILMFLFVKTPEDYMKYAAITVFATSGGNLFNVLYIRKYVHLRVVRNVEWKKHLPPVFVLFFNSVATTVYVNSGTTILGLLQSEEAVGIYGLSSKIYTVVKQMMNAIIAVSIPRFSQFLGKNDREGYNKLSNTILTALCIIIFPACVGLLSLSKDIIRIVGGSEYLPGANALMILSASLIFAVVGSFYSWTVFIPFKQEKVCLFASVVSAVLNIALNFVLIPTMSYNGAALTTLIAEITLLGIYLVKGRGLVKIHFSPRTVSSVLFGCGAVWGICTAFRMIPMGSSLRVMVCIVVSVIAYFLIHVLFRSEFVMDALKNVKKIRKK